MKRCTTRAALLAVGCSLAAGVGPLFAQSPLVCSLVHYTECNADGECGYEPDDRADSPAFVTIDMAAGIVRATEPRFSGRSSPILNSHEEAGRIMLTGVQGGRAWSITFVEATSEMSLAISDPDAAILVFGRCFAADSLE